MKEYLIDEDGFLEEDIRRIKEEWHTGRTVFLKEDAMHIIDEATRTTEAVLRPRNMWYDEDKACIFIERTDDGRLCITVAYGLRWKDKDRKGDVILSGLRADRVLTDGEYTKPMFDEDVYIAVPKKVDESCWLPFPYTFSHLTPRNWNDAVREAQLIDEQQEREYEESVRRREAERQASHQRWLEAHQTCGSCNHHKTQEVVGYGIIHYCARDHTMHRPEEGICDWAKEHGGTA